MTLTPATAEAVAMACAELSALGPFPGAIDAGLAAADRAQMMAAVAFLTEARRTNGLRAIVDPFRHTADLEVWAIVACARISLFSGDFRAGLAEIEEAIRRFPQRAAAHWWMIKARCLEGAGEKTASIEALEAGASRFPDDLRGATLGARAAEERQQFARASEIWRDAVERLGGRGDSDSELGLARALFRVGRIDESLSTIDELLASRPNDAAAARERAWMAGELGDAADAAARFSDLTTRFPALSQPYWWATLARARHETRDFAGGEEALAELERRFPNSALAEIERLRLDHWLERGQDDLTRRVEAALHRFPNDAHLRGQWTVLLLGLGRLEEARRCVESLEADAVPGQALIARLRYEGDRGGDAHVRAYAGPLAQRREWSYEDAVAALDFLLRHRTPWAFALAEDIAQRAEEVLAGRIWAIVLRATLRIARRDDEAAIAMIDAIPARYARPDVNELRAWAASARGRLDEAKALWRVNVGRVFFAAIDCPIVSLDRLSRDLPPPEGGVSAYVVFRNEAPQLPAFLAHHRRLGVQRFVFFDHMSDDESCKLLLAEPDVVLYQSRDSYQFSSSGRRWVREIVAREGARGWGLQVDPDEYFIYPGFETTPLNRLVAYLDAHCFEGVRSYMLDLFPRRLLQPDGEPTPLEQHRFYDADYAWIGQERPPHISPVGGVRSRLFGATEFLHKTPLWRLDAGELLNSHETTPLALADVTSALLHYKLFNMTVRGRHLAPEDGALPYLEADANVEVMRRHTRYAARLAELWRADLVAPGVSREVGDSLTLVAHGMMEAPPGYRAWIAGA